jgi:hypothetical protein
VVPRKKRRRASPYTQPFATADGPNRVWCADFKGWFQTGDGERIDPLTITDAWSRYLLRCQQKAFDRFRREYNEERPHEALGQETPSAVYTGSTRVYPTRVPEPEYGSALQVRRVGLRGVISWKHHHVFLSETLIGESIGLLPIDERFCVAPMALNPG